MEALKKELDETVEPSKSIDIKRFIAKHRVKKIDNTPATEDQKSGGKQKDKSRKADYQSPEDESVYEGYRLVMVSKENETFKSKVYDTKKDADSASWKASKNNKWKSVKVVNESADIEDLTLLETMTDKQKSKREDIVKSMKKKSGDMKDRYGDDWKNVLYATATKMALKEEPEYTKSGSVISPGVVIFKDDKTVSVSKSDAKTINDLFNGLNPSNRKKMWDKLISNKVGYTEILQFAKEVV